MSKTKESNTLKIKTESGTYTVSLRTEYILGKGGYGLVYEANDKHLNKVAAKAIGEKQFEKIIKQDWAKLLKLEHENLVKIFDVQQQKNKEKTLWVFMEFCAQGDLDRFYSKDTITVAKGLNVMTQIAKAINYLHAEDVIHRDIKPSNILIASLAPFVVKVTDFDISKFLEQNHQTSGMSSDKGTPKFKAPEFFLKNEKGKIRYHRNVDTYAFGLTILAMLQSRPGKPLIPQIETPQDVTELRESPGLLVATRKQHRIQELRIVLVSESDFGGIRDPRREIKKLVQKMTCAEPQARLSATQVVQNLEDIGKDFPSVEEPLSLETTCESSEPSEVWISRTMSSSRDQDSCKPEKSSHTSNATKSSEPTGEELQSQTSNAIKSWEPTGAETLYSRQEPPMQV